MEGFEDTAAANKTSTNLNNTSAEDGPQPNSQDYPEKSGDYLTQEASVGSKSKTLLMSNSTRDILIIICTIVIVGLLIICGWKLT